MGSANPDVKNYAVAILGATSAMARALAHEFARGGYTIILAARDDAHNAAIAQDIRIRFGVDAVPVHIDATDFNQHNAVVNQIVKESQDRLAGVVLCFGYMQPQDHSQEDADVARSTIDINLTAAVTLLERFAREFEVRRTGFIAVVSSVAGDRGRQSNYIYGAAKAGLSAYTQGLRNRLFSKGVSVTTIKPGFVDTKMTFGLPGMFLVASPERAARAMASAIRRRRDIVYVPFFWRYIMMLIRLIPERLFKRLKL